MLRRFRARYGSASRRSAGILTVLQSPDDTIKQDLTEFATVVNVLFTTRLLL
jgi:hypothetical protein